MRTLKNTLSVLIATALTVITLYAGVQIAAGSTQTTGASAVSATAVAGQTYMCPQTGCTSPTCHAISGTNAQTTVSASDGSSNSSSGGTMTCPRTGCTASTCHGATHSPPPTTGSSSAGSGIVYQ